MEFKDQNYNFTLFQSGNTWMVSFPLDGQGIEVDYSFFRRYTMKKNLNIYKIFDRVILQRERKQKLERVKNETEPE